jgi:hypothetical protein
MKSPAYPFLRRAGRILNSGQARTLFLTGNLHDLFHRPLPDRPLSDSQEDDLGEYMPLVDFLRHSWRVAGRILLVYELNGPIRFVNEGDRDKLREAWIFWRTGLDSDGLAIENMLSGGRGAAAQEVIEDTFEANLQKAIGNPTVAFELLRQLCICSRFELEGKAALAEDLIIVVEAADLALPEGQITSLSDADRRRLAICQDWFSDPGFVAGGDSVVLLAESRSLLHHRIARLPQILDVEIPSPNLDQRRHFITWFNRKSGRELKLWGSQKELAELAAGLSLHALAQLLKGAVYHGERLERDEVVGRVEAFIRSQLGDDVIEFKKPEHRLTDVVGQSRLREFLNRELIPRFRASGPAALPGAAVAGPIGGGKTFLFEAVAAELDMVVLVLKNLRSQYFGQTDVIFERLRRVLEALSKVVIFIDEADTQFGGVGAGTHATERRLTGKIQAMMSDPRLRGRVLWLLMTARIHLLSPDIRRPGRVGELIIPVLDPEGEDRQAFLRWAIEPALTRKPTNIELSKINDETTGYSPAAFAALRAQLKARTTEGPLHFEDIRKIIHDQLPPDIFDTRRYQTLQALLNCTRRSLLPKPGVTVAERREWAEEIRRLEARGVG